jgi:RimJ/RimL family protein N-acetyltransferase
MVGFTPTHENGLAILVGSANLSNANLKSHSDGRMALKKGGTHSVFKTNDGKLITLRSLRRTDLDALLSFANGFAREKRRNRELGIISFDRTMTRANEKAFLDKTLLNLAKRRGVSIAAFDRDRLVGHCDIAGRASDDERHTGVLGIIVADGYRGVGLGGEMVRIALAQASKLGIWAIELEVFATNEPARHLYEKFGFRKFGTIPKKVIRDGKFIDVVGMYAHLPHRS